MDAKVRSFIRTFVKEIRESNAAIFAGAGLSRPAGYVDWKELLREVAEDLGLDVDKETDLISLAQYHVNEHGRGKINQILLDQFTKDSVVTDNHRILAQLPIDTYWTTNYDNMIEKALETFGKKVDVKRTPVSLATTLQGRDATVYKMHGDIALPEEAVLARDDYERYNDKRKQYTLTLQGDLMQKTFLFIGFSFDDPNLHYILSRIRVLLGENQRNHYCFMKQVERTDYETEEDYHYATIKQELRVKDLKRFSINVLLVEKYSDITDILRTVAAKVKQHNVFVSGSATDFGSWGEQRVFEFATNLSKMLIQLEENIVTGFGLGIGSCVISGALEEIYRNKIHRSEQRLQARPFPQQTHGSIPLAELWEQYRREMISQVGLAIFMFGNKPDKDTGEIIEADGMVKEFDIAVGFGAVPIPIGATGFAAETLWKRVMSDFEHYVPDPSLRTLYEVLGDKSCDELKLIDTVESIIRRLKER